METKPTYEELAQKVKKLEKELLELKAIHIHVDPIKDTAGNSIRSDITGFKEVERIEQHTENLYRQLIDLNNNPVHVYDRESRLILMNRKTAEILGGKPEDFTGKKLTEIFISPMAEDLAKTNLKILDTGQPADYEIPIEFFGKKRWYWSHAQPMKDKDGYFSILMVISYDITERKNAEEVLRRRENLLNQTQKLAHIGSYEYDIINNHFERSDELFRILGINRDEVNPEERITKCVHPDDMNYLDKIFQLLESGHKIGAFEFRIIRPDGEERVVSANAEIKFDDSGVPIKRTGYLLDITERKRLEEELRRSEYLLNQAQKLAHLGSYEWDIMNKRCERSDELLRIFGLSRDTIAPEENLFQWVHPDDRDYIAKGYQSTKAGQSTGKKEFRIIRPDGEERYLLGDEDIILDDSGIPIKSIGCVLDITELKKVEEELRKSKNLLDQAQQLAHLGSYELDIINKRYERSDELFRIFGITRDTIAPEENLFQWVHPDDKGFIEKSYKDTMSGRSTGKKEFRIIRPDGEERYLIGDENVMFDDMGTPIRSIGCVLDITELKKVEEELRWKQYFLEQAQKLANLGSYEYDIKNKRYERSAEIFRIFGISRNEVNSEDHLTRWIHPDDRERIEEVYQSIKKGHNSGPQEFRIIRPDGEERVVFAKVDVMFDDNGTPIKCYGYLLDITERKKMEDKLRKSENMLNRAQELAHIGSFERDMINNTFERSDELFRIFGIKRHEVSPKERMSQWIHPDDRDYTEQVYQANAAGGKIGLIEFRIIRPDGEERIISSNEDITYNDSGIPIKSIGYVIDITERKKTEAEREKLILELQQALDNVKTLRGLLPICSKCKKIRTDKGYWSQIEVFIQTHTDASFTHSMCPVCVKEMYGDEDWYKNINIE